MFAKLALFLCVLGFGGSGLAEVGALEIYPRATQVGTVARRVMTDQQNRPVCEIYYRSKSSLEKLADYGDLVTQEIRLHSYDDAGRKMWTGVYSGAFILGRSCARAYDRDGQLEWEHWRESDGVVRYRIHYENGRSISHLHYDETGKRVTKVQGKIPNGIDPASVEIIK